ncbi:MAG TPA: PfkB family carbohydrate kinase [Streptosporangiaceae bacterium]
MEERLLMDVIAVGDNTSDCYLSIGQVFPGGNAVNVAVAVARSGGSSAYVGVVGDDARGRLLIDSLAAERVDARRVSVAGGPTAYCQVMHAGGERLFEPGQRGVALFRPTEDDLAFAATASIIHSTYRSGLEDVLPDLARLSRVSFDFSDHLDDGYADDLLPFVHVAEFSAAALDDGDCAELARWAVARGPAYVLVTRGSKGATLFDGAVSVSVSAAPSTVIDSLGAGDSFIGRALHGLIRGESAQALLEASARAAARTCSAWGGFGHGVPVSTCRGSHSEASAVAPFRNPGSTQH